MTNKEALKSLCNHCEKLSIRDGFIGCPFRNISNDYCEEFETIEKDLEVLEILKKKNINIRALKSWNKTYKGKLTYQNYLDILDDCDLGEKLTQEEYDILKEVLL